MIKKIKFNMHEKSKQKGGLWEILTLKLERFHIDPFCLDECSIIYIFASNEGYMKNNI